MGAVIDNELLIEFIEESEEGIVTLNEDLLAIEEELSEGKKINTEYLNDMFRVAHSIKGASSFFGLNSIGSLTHELESLMDLFRAGKVKLNKNHTSMIFNALDRLHQLFTEIKQKGHEETDIQDLVIEIKKYINEPDEGAPCPDDISVVEDNIIAQEQKETTGINQDIKDNDISSVVTDTEAPVSPEQVKTRENQYVNEFILETEENLLALNESLLKLEKEPEDQNELNNAFRVSHTIKGSAGLLGFPGINKVMHSLEDFLAIVREGRVSFNSELISYCFKILDQVDKMVGSIKNSGEEGLEVHNLVDNFNVIVASSISGAAKEKDSNNEQAQNSVPQQISNDGSNSDNLYLIIVKLEGVASLKSIRVTLIRKKLSEYGSIKYIYPDADVIDQIMSKEDVEVRFYIHSNENPDRLKEIADVDTVKSVTIKSVSYEDMSKYISANNKEEDTDMESETPQKKKEEVIKKKEVKEISRDDLDASYQEVGGAELSKKSTTMQTVRVDIRKLDNLMNLAGELVITKAVYGQLVLKLHEYLSATTEDISELNNIISEMEYSQKKYTLEKQDITEIMDATKNNLDTLSFQISKLSSETLSNIIVDIDENTARLGKVSSDIQSDVMLARMVPIYGVFNKFKRIIRDLSLELKKEVKLEIYGEETEIDKKIIDELADPLTHMIRNAMDHGFETPEERLKLGKPSSGTLKLIASHKGNSVFISVVDDGKGIDIELISKKALEKGLVTRERLEQMSEKDRLHLILLPGFSTTEQVSSLSGRGVGMDVVQKMAENVGGTLKIKTEKGVGSSIVIKIPLTLAIIKALLVSIGKQIYAFPLDTVIEVVKISRKDVFSIDGSDTIRLRGTPIALLDLSQLIGIDRVSEVGKDNSESKYTVVIVSDGTTNIGVIVSSLIGGEEIVIKALSDHFSDVTGISGASILGNGAIAQIFDVGAIINMAE